MPILQTKWHVSSGCSVSAVLEFLIRTIRIGRKCGVAAVVSGCLPMGFPDRQIIAQTGYSFCGEATVWACSII